MTQSFSLLGLTKNATGAITAERFVGYDGDTAGAAGNSMGVARSDAAVGEDFPVDVIGTAIVEASAAIVEGAEVEVAANGLAVTQSAGVTVARALQAAGAAGERIEVLLIAN